jgi:hypothetical protein
MSTSDKVGVFSTSEGWVWKCVCGELAVSPVESRTAARDAYKIHRAKHKSTSGEPEEDQPEAKESRVTTAKKKTVKKKKATKKKKVVKKKPPKRKKIPRKKTAAKKKTTKKKKSDGKQTQRFTFIKNKKGKESAIWVTKKGTFTPSRSKKLGGRKRATKWGEIRSVSRAAAITALRAGKGTWYTRKGPVSK